MEGEALGKKIAKLIWWNWIVTAAVVMIALGVGLTFGATLPPEVPIFYSRPWGQQQLGKPAFLLIPIALAILVGLTTPTIAKLLKNDETLGLMVCLGGLATQIILILGLIRIILLVI